MWFLKLHIPPENHQGEQESTGFMPEQQTGKTANLGGKASLLTGGTALGRGRASGGGGVSSGQKASQEVFGSSSSLSKMVLTLSQKVCSSLTPTSLDPDSGYPAETLALREAALAEGSALLQGGQGGRLQSWLCRVLLKNCQAVGVMGKRRIPYSGNLGGKRKPEVIH